MDRPGTAIANAVVVLCSLIALSTGFADERAQTFGELGDWIVAPQDADASDPGVASHGDCPLNLGLPEPSQVRIGFRTRAAIRERNDAIDDRIGSHTRGASRAPAWAELAGPWRPLARALDAHEPHVRLELVCGTAPATALDLFQSPWLPLRAAEPPALACPDDKPLLLAARCQTATLRPLPGAAQ